MIRVLVADHYDVIRRGLALLAEREPDIRVVAVASTAREAVLLARRERPDVVLVDVSVPGLGGVAAARAILRDRPGTVLLALTREDDEDVARELLAVGFAGVVPTTRRAVDIIASIRAVAGGCGGGDQGSRGQSGG